MKCTVQFNMTVFIWPPTIQTFELTVTDTKATSFDDIDIDFVLLVCQSSPI